MPTWAKGVIAGGAALILVVAAFLIGAASNDEGGTVSDLEAEISEMRSTAEEAVLNGFYHEGESPSPPTANEAKVEAAERGPATQSEVEAALANKLGFEYDEGWGDGILGGFMVSGGGCGITQIVSGAAAGLLVNRPDTVVSPNEQLAVTLKPESASLAECLKAAMIALDW